CGHRSAPSPCWASESVSRSTLSGPLSDELSARNFLLSAGSDSCHSQKSAGQRRRCSDAGVTEVPDDAELDDLGIYDPSAPDADDWRALARRIFELGATRDDVRSAAA